MAQQITLMIRVSAELRKRARLCATYHNLTLRAFVAAAIEYALRHPEEVTAADVGGH